MVSRVSACALSFLAAASIVIVDSTVGSSASASEVVTAAQLVSVADLAPADRLSLESSFRAPILDRFDRRVYVGLGSADAGGRWTHGGRRSNFSVSDERGHLRLARAGRGTNAYLRSTELQSSDVLVDVSLDKRASGGGTYVSVIG